MSIFFFFWWEFFVLHRMVGRTWRGVLTPGYFEPCNFPSEWSLGLHWRVKAHRESLTTNQPESEKVSGGRETSHGGMSEKWNKAEFSRREVSVQFSSVAQSCPALCNPMDCSMQASLSITNSWRLLKHISIEMVMPYNHLIFYRPLLLLPSFFPSIRVFSNESALHIKWPKYWSFSFSLSLSNKHSGLISFRRDQLDLLAVQGTLKSLLQHHSSKASIHRCSPFFMVQLSH